jgi:hypothetical protein
MTGIYEEIRQITRRIAKAGLDLISVSAGWHQSFMPLIPMAVPRGAYTYLAQGIKEVVDVPVLAANRINNPFLAGEIKTVNVLEMMGRIGEDIGRSTRWTVLQSLSLFNVELITRAKVVRVTDKGVFYDREGQEQFIEADTVVIAMGSVPVADLKEKIEGLVPKLYAIGDCVKPRKALDAIHEAYAVAREI